MHRYGGDISVATTVALSMTHRSNFEEKRGFTGLHLCPNFTYPEILGTGRQYGIYILTAGA